MDLLAYEISHVLRQGACSLTLHVQLRLAEWAQPHLYFGVELDDFWQECVNRDKGGGSTEEKEGQLLVSQTFEGCQAWSSSSLVDDGSRGLGDFIVRPNTF